MAKYADVQIVVRRRCERCAGPGRIDIEDFTGGPTSTVPACEACGSTGYRDEQLLYPGEPFFLLRGKDQLAPTCVAMWAHMRAQAAGVLRPRHDTTAAEALAASQHMLEWQQANPGLVKPGD